MGLVFRLRFISSVLKTLPLKKKGEILSTIISYPIHVAVEVTSAMSHISLCDSSDNWFVRAVFVRAVQYNKA